MRVAITVVVELGEKPKLHIVPGNYERVKALKLTGAPETAQVWSELYDDQDPAAEAVRLTERAKLLGLYLNKHHRDLPKTDP